MVNPHNFNAVRREANRPRTWAAIALILGWTFIYGISELRGTQQAATSGQQPLASSDYWPDRSSTLTVPYQGARWQAVDASQAVALPRGQMVLLGEHNGVKFYGHPGDQLGGGGGRGQMVFQRLYAETPEGRFIPMVRTEGTADDGRFLPRNGDQ